MVLCPYLTLVTSLYVIVDNPRESAITLNNDIATIHAWSTKWLENFNPQKTETMTITRKINKPFHPPLIMNNTIINQVTEHKHLGLEISNDGSGKKHIDLITKKAFTRVNILRKFKCIRDRKTLERFILPSFGRFWNMQTSYGIIRHCSW